MSNRQLSHLSGVSTQETNTTGVTTPILEVDPDDGTLIGLLDRVSTGDAEGLPIFMDLRDGSDNPLPVDTSFIVRVLRPTDDEPNAVSVKEDNIASWNNLTVAEQRNTKNIDQVKINLKGSRINVRDKDTLRFELNGSAQIDWSNSELYVAREGVVEEAFNG
jgi:hypothetical protein